MTYQPPELLLANFLLTPGVLPDGLVDTDDTLGMLVFRDACPIKLAPNGLRAITISNAGGGGGRSSTRGFGFAGATRAIAGIAGSTGVYGSIVTVSILCDHTRDAGGNARIEDGLDRCWEIYGKLDLILNRPEDLMSNPNVQSNKIGEALPSFEANQNLPMLLVNYDLSVVIDN